VRFFLYAYQESEPRGLYKQGITRYDAATRMRAMQVFDRRNGRGDVTYRVIGEYDLGDVTLSQARKWETAAGNHMVRAQRVEPRHHPTEWFEPEDLTNDAWLRRVKSTPVAVTNTTTRRPFTSRRMLALKTRFARDEQNANIAWMPTHHWKDPEIQAARRASLLAIRA
jgi:hypothetical protein